jgi:predicted peroxiredoxin
MLHYKNIIKKYLIVIVFLSAYCLSNAQKVSVLFVGNSLTYFSDTPGKLKKMLQINGDSIFIEQCVESGFSLWLCFGSKYGLDMSQCVEDRLVNRKWDYIIIQNPNTGFLNPKQEMKRVIEKFDSLANKNGAKLIMCMPYITDVFPKYYCEKENQEIFCSSTLYKSTRQALDSVNVFVNQVKVKHTLLQAPIGEVHYQYDIQYYRTDLYTSDFGHPSELGAYLQACCYYRLITGTFYENKEKNVKQKTIEKVIKSIFSNSKN